MIFTSSKKFLVLASSAALLLSGCESMKNFGWPTFAANQTAENVCPVVGITPDLGNMTQLRNDQIVSETIISSITPTCTMKDNTSTIRLAINFKGRLGPEGVKDAKVEANYSIPYLVAVLNPAGEIISKDIFTITMVYKAGQTEQSFPDLLEQLIPVKAGDKITDYKIMLGFQLNEQELAFNRAIAANKAETK